MVGEFEENPKINKEEVNDFKWMTLVAVKVEMKAHPEKYTEWFKIIFDKFYNHLQEATL